MLSAYSERTGGAIAYLHLGGQLEELCALYALWINKDMRQDAEKDAPSGRYA